MDGDPDGPSDPDVLLAFILFLTVLLFIVIQYQKHQDRIHPYWCWHEDSELALPCRYAKGERDV